MERSQAMALVLVDPPIGDLANRHGIEVVQLFSPAPDRDDEVSGFKQREVFAYTLPCHIEALAELAEGLAAVRMEPVQQLPAAGICERLEDKFHIGMHPFYYMQLFGCMSTMWPEMYRPRTGGEEAAAEAGRDRLASGRVGPATRLPHSDGGPGLLWEWHSNLDGQCFSLSDQCHQIVGMLRPTPLQSVQNHGHTTPLVHGPKLVMVWLNASRCRP